MTTADKLKVFNPSLYYAMLEWKDKYPNTYRELFNASPVHLLSKRDLHKLARHLVHDTFESFERDQIELDLKIKKKRDGELDL